MQFLFFSSILLNALPGMKIGLSNDSERVGEIFERGLLDKIPPFLLRAFDNTAIKDRKRVFGF